MVWSGLVWSGLVWSNRTLAHKSHSITWLCLLIEVLGLIVEAFDELGYCDSA